MRNLLTSKPQPGHVVLHWEPPVNASLQQGDWKKVSGYSENKWRLYHPSRDQTALQDLSGNHPEKRPELTELFKQEPSVNVGGWAILSQFVTGNLSSSGQSRYYPTLYFLIP